VNSNPVTGNIVDVLSVTKTALGDNYTANDNITYVISINNSSAVPFTGLTVTDNLGEYTFDTTAVTPLDYVDGSVLYYLNGVLQATPAVTSTSPLVFSGITVPANGNAILIYEAETNGFAPLISGSTIANEVTVSGGGLTTPVTATETVTVTEEPVLSITKGLSPTDVAENSQLTYTFTIQNTGNTAAEATDNIVITDTFDPILSNITVTVDGATLPDTAYTYDETTGEFATVPGTITVPAATYTQDAVTGEWTVTPGVTVVTVTGTV
ncbi:MAG: hypothetical protein IJM97_08780, partial [Clostridia bacterium]|nr:hypothetical protein [Clostridia bacterium]